MPAAGGVRTMDNKRKTFSVPLFFRLLKHLTGILADTPLCSEDHARRQTGDQQQLDYIRPGLDTEGTLHHFR